MRVSLAAALQVRIVEGASQNWPLKSTPHRCSREEGEKKVRSRVSGRVQT
jgi:hypothetical protein